MLIDSLTFVLKKSGALEPFWSKLDAQTDATLAAAGSARPFLVAARFTDHPQPTLVVIATEDGALAFSRNLAAYLGDEAVLRFPLRSDYPGIAKRADVTQIGRRSQAIHALATGQPKVVVAAASALLRWLPPKSWQTFEPLSLQAGMDLCDGKLPNIESLEDIPSVLISKGYQRTDSLEGPGTFCQHGGTIDIFPTQSVFPVRLDFFGDELEEIRRIVPATGQTITSLESIDIFPACELPLTADVLSRARETLTKQAPTNPLMREILGTLEQGLTGDVRDALLPYVSPQGAQLCNYLHPNTLVTLIEPRSLFDDALHYYQECESRLEKSGFGVDAYYVTPANLDFGKTTRANYVSLMRVGGAVDAELPVKRVDIAGSLDKLYGKMRNLIDAGYIIVYSAPNFKARQEMRLSFVDQSLPIQEFLDVLDEDGGLAKRRLRKGVVNIVDVDIPLGMIIPQAHLALVSLYDTQGNRTSRPQKHVDITEITFPYKEGDYVVHAAHGVAHFKELVRRELDGTMRDYLLLEYAEGDKLYVPVEQLDRVTRYVGPEGSEPRLTRLNTSDWTRVLTKARNATKKLAFDLVDVYSRRATAQGFRFGPDTPWQTQMEESFPYSETRDQLLAIEEVKADMQSSKPMDRLICGDVGFGKTEVALRAAFKATQDKKQVMVLCPTTILAQQHYANFKDRFQDFGVRVDILSRFRTNDQQKVSLEDFAAGKVDVLIGTHRLLSRDVTPHDLGLVIIDEEQRFGVGHKEQFKNLRESVDVLTLSATPIPRTMQMAVSGVRDMSLIMTPPDDRRPIEVHVGEWDPDVVSAAIRLELSRKGQVYYVSNRVRTIEEAVERVHEAAPEARVGVAHGQMSKDALESVMEDFSAGELDVLVATTIIESGIDNPHTNTLIIEDSQRLGLAQMYQLKGRVGRSSTQAYAYFMFPENMALTEEATARLMALDEHQELGSGMRIALRDLEIRGAGTLLGAEQSGNMSSVGFDLFAQMLATAVNNAREGNTDSADMLPPALSDITVNIPGKAFLSEELVPAADMRVMWYRKIASAATTEQVDAIVADLTDKYKELPTEALNLLAKAHIKAYANEHGIHTVSVVAGKLVVEPCTVGRQQMILCKRHGGRYLADKQKLTLPLRYFGLTSTDDLFTPIAEFIADLVEAKEAAKG